MKAPLHRVAPTNYKWTSPYRWVNGVNTTLLKGPLELARAQIVDSPTGLIL